MENIKIEDIPEFDTRIKNALRRRGFVYLQDIEIWGPTYLKQITGLGKKSWKIIFTALYKYVYKKEELK